MTRRRSGTAILVLVACLCALTTMAQAQKQLPADYQTGVAQMRVAKAYLEKAGDHWGGHRAGAIELIDKAFQALGVSPESTPNELQCGNTDEPTMMTNGISKLQAARAEIAKSSNALGGRKTQALSYIDQALQQLQ